MFGYLIADPGKLTEEELARYKACYCGLCRSIGERHGQFSRLSLTYDMCFLVLLLGSLYEPEESWGEGRCLPHPVEERRWLQCEVTAYAADMNVALAYLKCLDDWEDDGNPAALAESAMIRKSYALVSARYPRQCAAIREALDRLHELEKNRVESADEAADAFGAMMAELFVLREDRWAGTLRSFGRCLGRFIYVMDAVMDLDADAFRNRYNPFRRYYGLPDNAPRFREILQMLLGDCLVYFDILPLVRDASILKNVLCAGLWTQFDQKYSDRKKADGSRSV